MKKYFLILLNLILLFSCNQEKAKHIPNAQQLAFCDSLRKIDIQLPEPIYGDWLYEHKENGQTYNEYINYNPVSPYGNKQIIYLLPIGDFSTIQYRIIDYTAEYLKIYFNLEVKILKTISDDIIPDKDRRMREDSSEQLRSTYILDKVLKKRIPSDAIVLMAITSKDLYPKDSWNFVFGQASIKERVGVSSIFRYSKDVLDSTNYFICLERLIKTSSHEIGHMFSLLHCINAVCVMNGSNGLYESDIKPNNLCSVCLKKLYWNLNFDIIDRYKKLHLYFTKHHLTKDADLIQSQLNLLQTKSNITSDSCNM